MATPIWDNLPNGTKRLYVIVGDPIAQVKSPAGMTRGFVGRGHDAVLVPIHVTPQDLPAFLTGRAAPAISTASSSPSRTNSPAPSCARV